MAALLEIEDLHVTFATGDGTVNAVNGVSFALEEGETLAIVGESGSGKSQTAYAAMGLLAANGRARGRVRYGGRDLLGLPQRELNRIRAKEIAMIFQDPMTSLNPVYRVGDQIVEQIQAHEDVTDAEARDRVVTLLERVGIPRAAERVEAFQLRLSDHM